MKMRFALAVTMPLAISANAEAASSYSGKWPLTVSHSSQFLNGKYCLTVTDDGSEGWKHSGPATIAQEPYGIFQVINGKFVADIPEEAQGQNNVLVFTVDAHNGALGNGAAVLLAGGAPLYAGKLVVGTKGGC
jgi:hypothetical protein